MTGIAGTIRRGGGSADHDALSRMLDAMSHRSQSPTGRWSSGKVALGQVGGTGSIVAVPGAEKLSQRSIIVLADARLDNVEDLAAACGVAPTADHASIIEASYRKWGLDFVERLLGDFAIALWDADASRLICIRDGFGVKPMFLADTVDGFFFASEANALLASGSIPFEPDERSIMRYVDGLSPEADGTNYRYVKRLSAGHILIRGPDDEVKQRRFFELSQPDYFSGDDAPDQFRDIFRESVKSRLVGSKRIGSMLSGGLDSSSITAVAASLCRERGGVPVTALSRMFSEESGWSERSHMNAVLDRVAVQSIVLDAEVTEPLGHAERDLIQFGGPFIAPGIAFTRPIYERAAEEGIEVVLDGHGGDEVVSFGWGLYVELAHAGRWKKLWQELSQGDLGVAEMKWALMARALTLTPAGGLAAKIHRKALRMMRGSSVTASLTNRDLSARQKNQDREVTARPMRPARMEQDQHFSVLTADLQSYGFELLNCLASRYGVEPRYPFWDRRLVNFCLSLPAHEKLDGGKSRLVLRRAMKDLVPDQVRWRRDKLDFSPHIAIGMMQSHRELLDDLFLTSKSGLASYVDMERARAVYGRLTAMRAETSGTDVQAVWRIAMLGIWLQSSTSTRG